MKRKGYTLVEVIVAFAIFAIVLTGVSATFTFTSKMETRNGYFIHFEAICADIDLDSDEYQREWDTYYYGIHGDDGTIYYSSDYQVVGGESAAKFVLTYSYDSDDQLIVNVTEKNNNQVIIRDLNYGGNRYVVTP